MKAQRIDNPPGDRPKKRLFNIDEAAIYLGRSVCALREMIWAGKIPCVCDGRRVLHDIHDIDARIEKRKTLFTY